VGTDAGLLRWDLTTDSITKYTPADGLLGFKIHDVTLDAQGRVWVGHEWGLSVLQGSAWTNYHRDNSGIPGDDVYQVAVAGDGTVWLYSRDRASGVGLGLTEFDGSMSWYTYTEGNSDLPDDRVDSIGLDNDDHLWVGTGDGAVAVFDGATWTVYNDPTYNHNSVNVVGPDPSGRMWFTSYYNTAQPVLMFDGAWHLITPESGCDGGVRQGAFDGSGTLWLTTWSGLCSYAGSTWTRYHEVNSDLLYDRLETIAAQGSAVWVGYGPDLTVEPVTITEFNGSAWDHHHKDRILPRGLGQGLAVDHDGQKWFGLMNKGVGMFDGDTWTAYDDTNSGLPDTCTVIIAVDLEGHLWFAGSLCAGGLVEYDGVDDWTQHYGAGVPHSWVQAVAVDQANRVWAGSPAGLSYYDGMGWYTYNESNSGLPNNNVSRIVVDAEAHIWVGCNTRFDGVTWEIYASPEAAIEEYYDDIVDTFYQDYRCWVPDPARGKV
jgi:ligand-binding sensor domain-containing protein